MEILGIICIIIGLLFALYSQGRVQSMSDRLRIENQNKMAENEMTRGIRIKQRMQERIDRFEKEGNTRLVKGLRRGLKWYSENHDDAGNRIDRTKP